MLTKQQANALRGHISNLVQCSKAVAAASQKPCSNADWKELTSTQRKSNDRVHKYLAQCTEPPENAHADPTPLDH